jgi:hypothetical protein
MQGKSQKCRQGALPNRLLKENLEARKPGTGASNLFVLMDSWLPDSSILPFAVAQIPIDPRHLCG